MRRTFFSLPDFCKSPSDRTGSPHFPFGLLFLFLFFFFRVAGAASAGRTITAAAALPVLFTPDLIPDRKHDKAYRHDSDRYAHDRSRHRQQIQHILLLSGCRRLKNDGTFRVFSLFYSLLQRRPLLFRIFGFFSAFTPFYFETAPFSFFLHTIAPRFRKMINPINPAASAATMNTVHHQVRIRYTAVAVR